MSFKASTWVWESIDSGLLVLEWAPTLVLLCLANHANSVGVCWPSHKRIATLCGLSESTVKRALRDLILAGIIARIADGRRNKYRLSMADAASLERGHTDPIRVGVNRGLTDPNRSIGVTQTPIGGQTDPSIGVTQTPPSESVIESINEPGQRTAQIMYSSDELEIWTKTIEDLERAIDCESFYAWIEPIVFGSYQAAIAAEQKPAALTIVVPSIFFATWIQSNYESAIVETFKNHSGDDALIIGYKLEAVADENEDQA